MRELWLICKIDVFFCFLCFCTFFAHSLHILCTNDSMNKTIYYSIILVVVTYWFYYTIKDEYYRLYCDGAKEKIVYYDDFCYIIWLSIGLFFLFVFIPLVQLIYDSFPGFAEPKKIGISPFMAESLYHMG